MGYIGLTQGYEGSNLALMVYSVMIVSINSLSLSDRQEYIRIKNDCSTPFVS
ncbi:MAG TPA: hypothetical protein V6D35_17820 [Candidatus Sericytochromatia bacterium]